MNTRLLYGVIMSHGLITDLLDTQQIISLTKTDNLKTFIDLLSNTPYADKFVEGDFTPINLEKAFYRTFIERITDVKDIVPRNVAEFLKSYCVKFELLNLKRIIQGKILGIPTSQIVESLLPFNSFDNLNLKMLAETMSLEEVVARLEETQLSLLTERIAFCKKYNVIWPLELIFNHKYAATVLKSIAKLPKDVRLFIDHIISVETDIENLLIAIRQRYLSEELLNASNLEDFFPIRYSINLNVIEGIIKTQNMKYFIETLPFPYSKILMPLYEGNFYLILTNLRQYIYEVTKNRCLLNDFNLNVIIAYILLCELEKDNLVGIAWGKSQNITGSEILKYLVIPQ